MTQLMTSYPIISADSHITEPPNCYTDYVDLAWRARAPRIEKRDDGDVFVIDGMKQAVNLGLVAAAGKPAEEITLKGGRFEELHRGGWDPDARMKDQVRDGVAAEVIYPTVGMLLCNHKDFAYKRACFAGYNRWLAEYCSAHPKRLVGMGQVAMASPEDGIAELHAVKALGLRGVMMPGNPAVEDYDSPAYDDFWRAALDLELPLAFHILTSKEDVLMKPRGPKMNGFLTIIRGCQDVIGTMLLGGVFERHPRLKIVCVEADAGWVPHYMYRMDHAFKRHRNWLPPGQKLSKLPSEYFRENVYVTFQDDWVAFKTADLMNWHRLMWANDFPHSDSTWPWSQELLAEHHADLRPEQRERILSGNAAELFKIDVASLMQ
jgi:predicted TIM-barrel fold metal-dependent hydrolase